MSFSDVKLICFDTLSSKTLLSLIRIVGVLLGKGYYMKNCVGWGWEWGSGGQIKLLMTSEMTVITVIQPR